MNKGRLSSRAAQVCSESELLADALEEIGSEKVRILQNGREKRITKQEANIIALVNAAVKRDRKAAKTLLRYIKEMKSAPAREMKTIVMLAENTDSRDD